MTAVVVEGLTKRYGPVTAVDDVAFTLPAGRVTALLGPNGAGKTTTVEILEGFHPPTAGTVRVLGADPWRAGRAWRSRVGLVLQSTSIDATLTVREALRVYGRPYPLPRPVEEVLELVGLTEEAGRRVGALSGGQQRRVDLGLGVIGRPEMLFLDEPTTGLDPEARRRLWEAVENLTSAGTTVVLTTHHMEEAQRLADRVIVLSGGRVVADATPEALRGRTSVVRYRAAAGAPPLPAALTSDPSSLSLRTTDVVGTLGALLRWARESGEDLAGLEVGPPSLEDAYLELTREVRRG